ncbi:unnamed protein product [Euphydryas editha]|uniref:Lipase n=1 Tax=Euphydryas editha TaxID=104508 RepID=A0AAU9UHE0_EUPED|nr:unnamed protein product [Euphydryas editha]
MALKTKVTFNILLLSVAVILGNVLSLRLSISTELKRSLGYHDDSLLNFTELSANYGYASEEHTVVTEDGYILTIFRISERKCVGKLRRPPVILMHGLLQSSDAWLDAGPNDGLAYLISDACYDLWVGNQRGNYYSRRHVRLNPDRDSEFWKFSVDEVGLYDIPATIDYVLKYTQEEKLNYIGYSQGAGTFLIMCLERPGYCDKANVLIGLAPATKLTHSSVAIQIIIQGAHLLEELLAAMNIYEFAAKGSLLKEFFLFVCHYRETSKDICGNMLALLDSSHPGSIKEDTLRTLSGHFPSGTSVRTIAQYGQWYLADRFQKYDYGKKSNMKIYREERPPSYNLSAVTVPFITLYGRNDNVVAKKNVLWLVEQLPNVIEAVEVSDPLWNHFDVVYSQFTKKLIFPKIKEYLEKFSKSSTFVM